jgi:hypothetical protein
MFVLSETFNFNVPTESRGSTSPSSSDSQYPDCKRTAKRAKLPEPLVKHSDFWNGVNLSRVCVIAFDHQGQAVHHSLKLFTHGNSMLAEPGQEILGITGFHTIPAELIANEVGHGSILLR